MIFDKSRNWPHPVLTPLTDDVSPNAFDFELDVWPDEPRWRLRVEAKHEDETIQNLIAAKKACYLLHVECKRTYYREAFTSTDSRFESTVPGDRLFGVVETSFLVVATKDINKFQHPGQHKDYRDASFPISIGEPIAVAVSKSFEAPLESDPILKLSSIIDIQKGEEDARFMKINCQSERIILILPPSEYDRYRHLRTAPNLRGLLATTVVMPSLLQSLHYLRELDSDELGEFKADHRWSRLILTRLEAMGVDITGGDEGGAVCIEATQRLLRGPLRRGLEDLASLFL
jgi:hypothetical protein